MDGDDEEQMPKLLLRRPLLPHAGSRRRAAPGRLRSALASLRFALRHEAMPSLQQQQQARAGGGGGAQQALDRLNASALARRLPKRPPCIPKVGHPIHGLPACLPADPA